LRSSVSPPIDHELALISFASRVFRTPISFHVIALPGWANEPAAARQKTKIVSIVKGRLSFID
jgi:hypothetical protein